jgi:hypothetical protein
MSITDKDKFITPEDIKDGKLTKGLRFNKGKLRYELLDQDAIEGIARVLTYGAEKYTVKDANGNILTTGANNWQKGISWSSVIGSLKRHLAAIEKGEDYDQDLENCKECKEGVFCMNHSQLAHIDHLMCNAMFLSAYYRIYPQGDDRRHKYLNVPKIGLDVDEVLADWLTSWTQHFNMKVPTTWFFDKDIFKRFTEMQTEGVLDQFYLDLKPKIKPMDIPFEPHCYITSRPVSSEITQLWLDMNGFPSRPVYTVGMNESKIDVAKNAGVEVFVDDRYENFVEFNKAGITCFLLDAPHNQRYKNIGHKRIKTLNELPWFKK